MEKISVIKNNFEKAPESMSPKKNNKTILMLVALALLILASALNKDLIVSEYKKFMPEKSESEMQAPESSTGKNTENSGESGNFIKDTYFKPIDKARDQLRISSLRDIKFALEVYYTEHGSYPISSNLTKLNDTNSSAYNDLKKYVLPSNLKDPKDPDYFYMYRSDGTSYEISARLEDTSNPECVIVDNICIYKISSAQK